MHETLAISAPNRQIHRRKGQTCTHVYRPDNGDPTHRLIATTFEFLFVRWTANLTEGHLPTGNRVANAKLLIRGSLIIPLLLKIPCLNIFSENCEEKFSKNEQFSSRPLFTCSHGNSGMKFPKGFRFGQKFE
jgi:rubredoxin